MGGGGIGREKGDITISGLGEWVHGGIFNKWRIALNKAVWEGRSKMKDDVFVLDVFSEQLDKWTRTVDLGVVWVYK